MRAVLLAILAAGSLAAQVHPPAGDQLFWEDRILYRAPFALGSQPMLLESRAHRPSEEKVLPLPSGLMDFHRQEGRFQAMKREGAVDGKVKISVLQSRDSKTWETEAWFEVGPGDTRISSVRAMGRGRFLLRSSMGMFNRDGKSSPLAIGRSNGDRRIQTEELVDLGLPKDLPAQALGLIFAPATFAIEGGWVLIHAQTGLGWIVRLSPEGTPSVRRFSIFSWVGEGLKKGLALEHVLLAAQPTVEGKILIATRSDSAVRECRGLVEKFRAQSSGSRPALAETATPLEGAKAAGYEKSLDAGHKDTRFAEDLAVKAHPEVLWWQLDPDTGKLSKVNPGGASVLLTGAEDLGKFGFRFLANGRLVMN